MMFARKVVPALLAGAGFALAVWWLACWPLAVALAAVLVGIVNSARRPARPAPAAEPEPADEPAISATPCPYGSCPRCTGAGTAGTSALDVRPQRPLQRADEPEPAEITRLPARRRAREDAA